MSFPLIWALIVTVCGCRHPRSIRSLIFIAINILLLRSGSFFVNVAVPGRAQLASTDSSLPLIAAPPRYGYGLRYR
jgi:hypothetical protein